MELDNLSEIIRYGSIFSVAIPLISYLAKARSTARPVHFIGWLSIISALSDLIAYFLFKGRLSTIFLFNTYYLLQFFLLSGFYYQVLKHTASKKTVIGGVIIFLVGCILINLFLQSFYEYQTLMWTVAGFIMIAFSIACFIFLFNSSTSSNNGMLWINSGVLFYFSFNLFLFVISSHILTQIDPQIGLLVWSFHNVNNIVKNILFGLGISVFVKKPE